MPIVSTSPSAMPSVQSSVIINEVFFQGIVNHHWIEIFNRNEVDVDLSGYKISWYGASFTFPTNAKIPSKEYRLLGIDSNVNQNGGCH
jgi:hypothetical protein